MTVNITLKNNPSQIRKHKIEIEYMQ